MRCERAVEVTGVVQRPSELEQRAIEVVRARRQPRRLERRLAELDRIAQTALHLEGEVPGERERHEQPALAEGARDRDTSLGVSDRVLVVLEICLRPGEVIERLEAWRELGVREGVDLGQRLSPMRSGVGDMPGRRLRETECRRSRSDERSIADLARRRQSTHTHLHCLREVELVETVDGELDLEHCGLDRRAVGKLLPGA